MSIDNYPDDIRRYDNDPRSPFYVEPPVECDHCDILLCEGDSLQLDGLTLCHECFDELREE